MTKSEKFIIARWAYAIGEEYISDVEYDRLEREMKETRQLKEYTDRGWSEDPCPVELLTRYNLEEYISSAIYTYSTESIESLNTPELVRDKLGNTKKPTRVSYKEDGFSIRLNYYNGELIQINTRTRHGGKSIDMESIRTLFKTNINKMGKVLVIGELSLNNKRINDYKQLRGIVSQRSGVSTAIANGDVEFLGYRCFNIYSDDLEEFKGDKYRILESLGLPTPKHIDVHDYNGILKAIEVLGRQKNMYSSPTDGVVVENEDSQYAVRIGAWEEECNESYVTGYVFNRGMYKNSVLVSIKNVFVNEKTVKEITVTNLQTIIDNNLRVGLPIAFVERSGVNSILDTERTLELQLKYRDDYEGYRKQIDNLEGGV